MKKIAVGILGATGLIGQHYIHLLQEHPWFEVTFLGGSQEGPYEKRVEGKWHLAAPIPPSLFVHSVEDIEKAKEKCHFVFSALPNEQALIYETAYAAAGLPVISNASFHRNDSDVPLLIPEVNGAHIEILDKQRKNRGWKKGFIVAKPNCSIQSYVLPLAPLHQAFRVRKIFVTTLQAMSGAGHTGLPSHSIQDNIIPFIRGEEEKSESEPLKIWGKVKGEAIIPTNEMTITAHCNRVPVLDGHLACVSVQFETKPSEEDIREAWHHFHAPFSSPLSSSSPILYRPEIDRPQTRLDREVGRGMCVSVGRLRPCSLLDYRFVGLSHNAVRGGAGGGILNAEFLYLKGYLSHGF